MLNFLVTSKARRRLLMLVWGQNEAGSVAQLAKLARVGFASAYRELGSMQALGLVVSDRKEAAEVFRANSSHPLAHVLQMLVNEPSVESREARQVRGQLKALGAPLQAVTEPLTASVEETVVRGVKLAHTDPDVARTLSLCLYRQRDVLQPAQLQRQARQLKEKRALGFFLDLTAQLSGDSRFTLWATPLRDRRCTASRDLFYSASQSLRQRRLAEQKTPAAARSWGLRMNMDIEAFRSAFEKFAQVS